MILMAGLFSGFDKVLPLSGWYSQVWGLSRSTRPAPNTPLQPTAGKRGG